MARIKIEDLPDVAEIRKDQMDRIVGGQIGKLPLKVAGKLTQNASQALALGSKTADKIIDTLQDAVSGSSGSTGSSSSGSSSGVARDQKNPPRYLGT